MQGKGLKPGTAHQMHRTARTAFGEAFKRGYIARNPVALAKPPRVEDAEVDPFDADEIDRILTLALRKRNGVRFVIALALGLRQGEALGLKWSRLYEPSKTPGDHEGTATADLATWLRRPAGVREHAIGVGDIFARAVPGFC